MQKRIDEFLEYLPNITQEQADTIAMITKWDDETKMAFNIAKHIFEMENEEEEDE